MRGHARPRRRVHIISIGIDHYDDRQIRQLRFAGSDAARFPNPCKIKAGSSVEIISQSLLLDAAASREAILAKLNETIAKAGPGDSIILFIAGHGVKTPPTRLTISPLRRQRKTISRTRPCAGVISRACWRKPTRGSRSFSIPATAAPPAPDFFATNDASVSALIDRAPSGILIFSASKGREL